MKDYVIMNDNKKLVHCDLNTWSQWMKTHGRIIIQTNRDNLLISTVFLGAYYAFTQEPKFFETMVFPDNDKFDNELYCDKYVTYEQAINGHIKACKRFLKNYTKDDLFVDKL